MLCSSFAARNGAAFQPHSFAWGCTDKSRHLNNFLTLVRYVVCRFTKDTESVDTSVSYSVQSFMTCSISVFGAILVVTAVTPMIVVAIALLGIVYYRVQVSTLALMLVCNFLGVRKH